MKQKLMRLIAWGALLMPTGIAHGAPEQVSQIDGNWKIDWNEALGDLEEFGYHGGDQRLAGQLVSFSESRIYDRIAGEENCTNPHIRLGETTLFDTFVDYFSTQNGYGSESAEIAFRWIEDWDIDRAKIYRIFCGDSPWHATKDQKAPWGNWLALSNDNRMMMPGPAMTILLLSKLPGYVRPAPSFPCRLARSRTEKAICTSYRLSVLDRNIAYTLKIHRTNKERNGGDVRALVADQVGWLHKRDRCGADFECLQSIMETRLALLVTQPDRELVQGSTH